MKYFSVLLLVLVVLFVACTPEEPQSTDPDVLFDALAQSGEKTNDELARLKSEQPEELLDYLMTCFLNGELQQCHYNDSSAAALKFSVWSSMLEGDEMPLETQTPLEYWDEWCALAHRSYASADQCPPEMPALRRYLMLVETRTAELDALFEDLAAAGETTSEQLTEIKQTRLDELLVYLMTEFEHGALEGCQLDDGSVGTLKFHTWAGHLGMEGIESVLESPQQYWNEWSAYAKMLYDRNGLQFLQEYDYPMCARYVEVLEN